MWLQRTKAALVTVFLLGAIVPSAEATVAFDANSSSPALDGTAQVWTHTPVGTPRAVVVYCLHVAALDEYTTVTYGSLELTEVAGSPNILATGEIGGVSVWFGGSSIPTGAQTVTASVSGTTTSKGCAARTFTASADVEVVDVDGLVNASLLNPTVTLALNSRESYVFLYGYSGVNDVTAIAPFTNWTADAESDIGNEVLLVYSYNITSDVDVSAGWTAAADDVAFLALALSDEPAPVSVGCHLALLGVGC